MGLNDIKLPASVVAALYPDSLVLTDQVISTSMGTAASPAPTRLQPDTVPLPPVASAAGWKYLGNNKKQILIIVEYADVPHLPDEELNFLTGMLTACKLDLGDVAIVNRHHYPNASPRDYMNEFNSRIVFLFGMEPAMFGLPVSFPQFQVQQVAGITYLYAPVLEDCKNDKLIKTKLWVCLKRIFSI